MILDTGCWIWTQYITTG